MPSIHPNIFAKGLILVSVPLAFEFAFLFTYFQVQQNYDAVLEKEALSREIIFHANEINIALTNAISQKMGDALFGIPDQSSAELLNHMEVERVELQKLIVDRPHSQELLSKLRTATVYTVDLMNQFEKPAAGAGFNELMSLEKNMLKFKEVEEGALSAGDYMEDFRKENTVLDASVPQEVVSARQRIQCTLGLGMVLSAMLTGVLFAYFITGFYRQIETLLRNTKRFAVGDELLPESKGNDELAILDRSFHKMAMELERAIRRERASINNAADIICVLDQSFKINFLNPAAEKILGFKRITLKGKSIIDMAADKNAASIAEQQLKDCRVTKKQSNFEFDLQDLNGNAVPCLFVVHWSEQEQEYFCVIHDIGKQRKLEVEKQAFSAMIADELHNPLSAIHKFLAQLNLKGPTQLSPEAAKGAQGAYESCNWLLKLLSDLMDTDRRHEANMTISTRSIRIDTLAEQAIASLSEFARQRGIEIVSNSMPAELNIDPDRILQVLVNLLSNAIKFSPEQGRIILQMEDKDNTLLVSVIDNGPGISEEEKQRLFAAYSQLESKDSHTAGTGLGLAVCKEIIDLHGGSIDVDSQIGKGSSFWFRLPRPEVSSP